MKYLKYFESIRDEYADMFAPRKPEDEPQPVPGFESGTIDPNDGEIWGDNKISEKEMYQEFLKITRERNFKETEDEIIINMKRLWEDFLMTIYEQQSHYKKFLRDELVGKYVSKGYRDYLRSNEEEYEGIIKEIGFLFDGDSCFVELQLKEHEKIKNGFVEDFITIDKMKTTASKYNL
jgi:hypothetical protein